jgi:hypothetical protein
MRGGTWAAAMGGIFEVVVVAAATRVANPRLAAVPDTDLENGSIDDDDDNISILKRREICEMHTNC